MGELITTEVIGVMNAETCHDQLDVICPVCTKSYLETTDKYDPEQKANGSMVTLKDPWKKWKWSPFGDGMPEKSACKESRKYYAMNCPGCEGSLCPSGKLKVREKPQAVKEIVQTDKITKTVNCEGIELPLADNATITDEFNNSIGTFGSSDYLNSESFKTPDELAEALIADNEKIIKPETRNEKIFRLHKAKWTNVKIAKEVGLSAVMVGKILKKKKAKK